MYQTKLVLLDSQNHGIDLNRKALSRDAAERLRIPFSSAAAQIIGSQAAEPGDFRV